MSGWSTPQPLKTVTGDRADWLSERGNRQNRFYLAYTKALLDIVLPHVASSGGDVEPLFSAPASEVARLLPDQNATLSLRLEPWGRVERLFGSRIERTPLTEEFYVPAGYSLLEAVFMEFVGERYISELFDLLDAYIELYTFGIRRPDRSELGWVVSSADRESWLRHLRLCYHHLPWRKEPWVDYELTPDALSRVRPYDSERRSIDKAQRDEFIQRVVEEDREWPSTAKQLEPCAALLACGPLGYWEKHRVGILKDFRADFIDGCRVATTIADDGKTTDVDRHWWQGDECTRLLSALQFRREGGVLLEKFASRHAPEVSSGGISSDQSGESDGFVGASYGTQPSLREHIARVGLQSATVFSAEAEVKFTADILEMMLDEKRLEERRSWPKPALYSKLRSFLLSADGLPAECRPALALYRKDKLPSKNAAYEAMELFFDRHPTLKHSERGGRPRSEN